MFIRSGLFRITSILSNFRHSASGSCAYFSSVKIRTPNNVDAPENELLREMRRDIAFKGPMNVYNFMKTCLTHPKYGFYMKEDVFGSKGHFITSPEVSQIFGELVGVWVIYEYLKSECRLPLRIVELGPGRGTLASDISRVCNNFKTSQNLEASFHLVEVSPFLIEKQRKNLCKDEVNVTKFGQKIQWSSSLNDVDLDPNSFTVYISNEFFDAFPIYKFAKGLNTWHEMLVDIHPSNMNALRWIRSKNETPAQKTFLPSEIKGGHFEIAPDVGTTITEICKRLNNSNGCSLICDYGFDSLKGSKPKRDTFRAYKNHQQINPLTEPGNADLTVDVDFDYVRNFALQENCKVFGTVSQAQFLSNLGIGMRLSALIESNSDSKIRRELISGVKMLLDDMGERFKFMAIYPQTFNANNVTGFEEHNSK